METKFVFLIICLIIFMISSYNAITEKNIVQEIIAIKSWLSVPFSSEELEAERDVKIAELQNLVKGEFETSTAFEERKRNANKQIEKIKAEYSQKIYDSHQSYNEIMDKLRLKLNSLLESSRETVEQIGSLGIYDPDHQQFPITIEDKTFKINVPLEKAPEVKQNFYRYSVIVTRQLNEDLEWDYLEARIEGDGNVFYSTEKAPTISPSSVGVALIPPDLSSTVSFIEPSGNNLLDAEEIAQLNITISNKGKGNAGMVEAKLDLGSIAGISYPKSVYFGEIKAGETNSKVVELKAGQNISTTEVELKINFTEQNGFPPEDKIIKFSTKSLIPPDIQIADIAIDDQNKNGKIEPGEQFDLLVRIQNKGNGPAKNVSTKLILGKDIFLLPGSNAENQFNQLSAGEYKDLHYTLVTAKTATKLNLTLDILEAHSQFNKLNQPLNLAFNRQERTAESLIIASKDKPINIENAPTISVDVEQNIPVLAKPDKNKWGVIFGIENYRNVGTGVPFAKRDAEYMKEYFQKVLGIPAENIYFQTDEATLSEFKTVFDPGGWLAKNANKPGNEIYIYYSGHGAPDPEGNKAYLLPADGNPNYASISGYSLEQLYSNLAQLKAKQITLFLDSCFSGASRNNEIILASARPVFISTALPSIAPNLAVFSASTGSQISSSYNDKLHGLFSYYLMKGLKGEADANGDKQITQKELIDYLNNEVNSQARRMGREQEPQLQSNDPQKVLVKW